MIGRLKKSKQTKQVADMVKLRTKTQLTGVPLFGTCQTLMNNKASNYRNGQPVQVPTSMGPSTSQFTIGKLE